MFLSPGMVGVLSDRDRVSSLSDSVAHSSDHGSASKKVYLIDYQTFLNQNKTIFLHVFIFCLVSYGFLNFDFQSSSIKNTKTGPQTGEWVRQGALF